MEPQTQTLIPDEDMIVNRSFTCQIKHVAMVYNLIEQGVGKDFSKVVRAAIEAYYEQHQEAK